MAAAAAIWYTVTSCWNTHGQKEEACRCANIHSIDPACWFCSQLFSDCQLQRPELASFITCMLIQWKYWQAAKAAENCEQRSQGRTLQPARPSARSQTEIVKHADAGNNKNFAEEQLFDVFSFLFFFGSSSPPVYRSSSVKTQWN